MVKEEKELVALRNWEAGCNIDTTFNGRMYRLRAKETKLFERDVADFLKETYPFLKYFNGKAIKQLKAEAKKKGKILEFEAAESKEAPVRTIKRDRRDSFTPKELEGGDWYGAGVEDDTP